MEVLNNLEKLVGAAMRKTMLVVALLFANQQGFNHLLCQINPDQSLYSLSTTTTWREYSLQAPFINFHKEKWAWTCSLTFKSKQPIKLNNVILQWNGEKLANLAAALYLKKERDAVLIPIEQNLVCEGAWNQNSQQLIFTPNEKIVAVNKYYLMISFPKSVESKIKRGQFSIYTTNLSPIDQHNTHTHSVQN
jgi:hypothetical protein